MYVIEIYMYMLEKQIFLLFTHHLNKKYLL